MLSAYFKNKKNKNLSSEIPTNNHHSMETFTEARHNEIQIQKQKNMTIKIFGPNNQKAESNARTGI